MLLSAIFSFRNEEENIPELVRRVSEAVAAIPDTQLEMIFVNDRSTDRSLELLLELQKTHPITILNTSRRFGVTPCIIAGLTHCKGDVATYLDADLQDPPELLPQMVEKYRAGADVVHTTRTHRDGENAFKMWVTKQAYKTINFFSDVPLPENTGDYKLLSRKVIDELLKLPERDPYMRGLAVWVGYKQEFIYYRRQPRFGGHTKMPLLSKGPVKEFLRGLTAFSAGPLYIAFFFGLGTCMFSVALILYALITKFLGLAEPGASGVLIAVAFFSGIVLMTNGVIGLYIARIYNEIKGRPRYLLDSIHLPPSK